MSEPEGQELQDKLVTIWYVMDQYQRDVEQWHDQKCRSTSQHSTVC